MNREKIYLPLSPNRLRVGDQLNFSIYLKSDKKVAGKEEYSLFFRCGHVFSPGYLARIKLNNIHYVYYEQIDEDKVKHYVGEDKLLAREKQIIKPTMQRTLEMTEAAIKEVYIPMHINKLQPGLRVNFHVLMEIENIKNKDYLYNILIPKGDVCRQAIIDDCRQKGINYVYYREQEEAEVLQYLYRNLDVVLKDDRLPPGEKIEMVYDVALTWAKRFYYGKHIQTTEEMDAGFKMIDYLMGAFHQDRQYPQRAQELRRHGDQLYGHCLNTCLLGIAFTKHLGWPDNDITEFAKGALLHDIGMIKVPQTVITKPGRLSAAEMELIKKHPQDSCRIIKKISPLSMSTMDMIFQHHEFGDGSGYLQGLKLPEIDPWARILRVIDSFEAMTSNRSWRKKFSPFDALQEMRKEWSERGTFDTNYLIEFIKFLSRK